MHADGYAGFEELYRSGRVREVACLAQLYAVEKAIRGLLPDERACVRQNQSEPVFYALEAWLAAQLPTLSEKTPLAAAIRYALACLSRLRRTSVTVAGGKALAIAATLIETAKMNHVDPQAWLADTLATVPDYKINRVDDLLPWKHRT